MTDLEILKKAFDDIGVHYKEFADDEGWTSISTCRPEDKDLDVDEYVDRSYEFDSEGKLASYP